MLGYPNTTRGRLGSLSDFRACRLPYERPPKDDHSFSTCEDTTMAKDLGTDGAENQIKGAVKEVAGKVRKNIGDLTDNHSDEMKG